MEARATIPAKREPASALRTALLQNPGASCTWALAPSMLRALLPEVPPLLSITAVFATLFSYVACGDRLAPAPTAGAVALICGSYLVVLAWFRKRGS